jgi:hypothetical protein
MNRELNKKSLIFGILGLGLLLVAGFLDNRLLNIIGTILLIIGFVHYFKAIKDT